MIGPAKNMRLVGLMRVTFEFMANFAIVIAGSLMSTRRNSHAQLGHAEKTSQ
jgi:hypothetical protein